MLRAAVSDSNDDDPKLPDLRTPHFSLHDVEPKSYVKVVWRDMVTHLANGAATCKSCSPMQPFVGLLFSCVVRCRRGSPCPLHHAEDNGS